MGAAPCMPGAPPVGGVAWPALWATRQHARFKDFCDADDPRRTSGLPPEPQGFDSAKNDEPARNRVVPVTVPFEPAGPCREELVFVDTA